MSQLSSNLSYKLISIAAGMLAGAATTVIAKSAWSTFRNDPPPTDPENPETGWKDALLWTLATGMTAGVTRLIIMRGANQGWKALSGKVAEKV